MNKFLMAVMLGGILLVSACDKKEEGILPKVSTPKVSTPKVSTEEQLDASVQSSLEREAFINQAQNEIDELENKLAAIRKKAVDATGQAKEKLSLQILELEQQQKNVEEQLARLKLAIGEKWKDFQAGVTEAIGKLNQSVKKAMQ